tara:strand:- start:104 stop:550 length:447 start_codon:yes stop_codon:yes gene_type:complete
MEEKLEPLFKSIVAAVNYHEESVYEKLSVSEDKLNEKNKQIDILEELCRKQKEEMEDFLKVSFANRWKKKAEELEKQKNHIENKLDNLQRTNDKFNHHLDKKTNLISVSTQTHNECIEIETKKGKYVLRDGLLLTEEGKEVGRVTESN